MIIYITMLVFWAIMNAILYEIESSSGKKFNRKVYLLLSGGSLLFIMAFRDLTVGTDLFAYEYEFKNALSYLQNELRPTELGYSYFNAFFKDLGINFRTYIIIIAFIFVSALSSLYYLYSKNIIMSFYLHITIGLFGISLTGIRQALAIAITMLAFIFLMKNKKLMFVFFVLLAYLFHNSAILFLILIVFKKIKLNQKTAIIFYIFSCSMFFVKSWLANIISIIAPINYVDNFRVSGIDINPLVILVSMLIPLACLFFWPKDTSTYDEEFIKTLSILFIISCLNFIIYYLALEILLFQRVSLYFVIYNTILLPNIIHNIKNKYIRALAIMACIVLPLIHFCIATPGGSMGIDDYKFFWD